jgi:hypothetical protein
MKNSRKNFGLAKKEVESLALISIPLKTHNAD